MSNKFTQMRLVKNEESSPILLQQEFRKEVCNAISQGLCTVPEDIVNLFKITYDQAMTLLNDPTFLSQIKKQTQAKLQLKYHTTVPQKLEEIIDNGDNKEKLQAIKMYAQLTDNLKNTGTDVNINLNLENLVKEAEKPINRLNDLDIEYKKVG